MKIVEQIESPKVVKSVLLVKLDNGNVHQALLSNDHMDTIVGLAQSLSDRNLKVLDPPLEGIDF
jgi:hypothetical protein